MKPDRSIYLVIALHQFANASVNVRSGNQQSSSIEAKLPVAEAVRAVASHGLSAVVASVQESSILDPSLKRDRQTSADGTARYHAQGERIFAAAFVQLQVKMRKTVVSLQIPRKAFRGQEALRSSNPSVDTKQATPRGDSFELELHITESESNPAEDYVNEDEEDYEEIGRFRYLGAH